MGSLSLIFRSSHSSKTSRSSFRQFSTVAPLAHTPSKPGISAYQLPSSNFLYSAFCSALSQYSSSICASIEEYYSKRRVRSTHRSGRHVNTGSGPPLAYDLERIMAVSSLDAIGTEVTSIYREYLAGSEGFSSNHQRCIRQVHRLVSVCFHQLESPLDSSNSRSPIDRIPLTVRFSLSKLKGNIERAVSGRRPSIL
jgi:hypothetical protein